MAHVTYQDAGVDLVRYEDAMRRLPPLMQRTRTPRVIDLPDGFAGLFALNGDGRRYEDPVLVSGTDGVGTKLKVARRVGRYDTVGIDLVAMCVNDCLCVGAEPLFFLDYVALGRDDPPLIASLVEGVSAGCIEARAALLGGETAIMPDVYPPDEFDLAGFCTGVVERARIVDGKAVRPGDVLIGLASTGCHSNGYSLVRKIVFDRAGLDVRDRIDELGRTVGETLLEPTRIYARVVADVLRSPAGLAGAVHGMAHITGGGLADNIARILPDGSSVRIRSGSWDVPPVFPWLQRLGPVETDEMRRVFNLGIGYVFLVDRDSADAVRSIVAQSGIPRWTIGEVVPGPPEVHFT